MIAGSKSGKRSPATTSDQKACSDQKPGVPDKKKSRNADPGVRVQGGRIYCSKTGTTCHQCRQKTVEDKRKCTTCTQYFCPKCLTNRYGLDQEEASRKPDWSCPKCQKNCSCSYCRKRAGLPPTGILANAAKTLGFTSVAALLAVNPDAAQVVQAVKETNSQAQVCQLLVARGMSPSARGPMKASMCSKPAASSHSVAHWQNSTQCWPSYASHEGTQKPSPGMSATCPPGG